MVVEQNSNGGLYYTVMSCSASACKPSVASKEVETNAISGDGFTSYYIASKICHNKSDNKRDYGYEIHSIVPLATNTKILTVKAYQTTCAAKTWN